MTLDDFVSSPRGDAAGDTTQFKGEPFQVGVPDRRHAVPDGHRETQTELLRLFNALQADGRQTS